MYRLFVAMLCFFLTLPASAQESGIPARRGGMRMSVPSENIQVERIAYFTEKMNLTPEEAQLFWPIYNEMDHKKTALFEEKAAIIRRFAKESDKITEKQLDELLERLAAINRQEAQIPGEYQVRFRKVLPASKVMNLYVAETDFRRHLLLKMRAGRNPERQSNQTETHE